MKRLAALSILGFTSALSGSALAQQWSAGASNSGYSYSGPSSAGLDNIGNAGQWVFGVERVTGLAFERVSRSYDDAMNGEIEETRKTTSLNLFGAGAETLSSLPRLALDYLPIDNVSVGLSAVLLSRSVSVDREGTPSVAPPAVTARQSEDGLSFLGNLRVGYAFPFDDTFGLWGRGGIAYGYETADAEVTTPSDVRPADASVTTTSLDITLDVMAVLSPFKHFVMMGGPFLDLGIGGDYTVEQGDRTVDDRNSNLTAFGLSFAVGGYY